MSRAPLSTPAAPIHALPSKADAPRRLAGAIALAGLLLMLALTAGCDGDEAEARQQLAEARQAFERANRGYGEPFEAGSEPVPYASFRHEALDQAASDLQAVRQSEASEPTRQTARRLLAEVYIAKARRATRQANQAMDEVRSQAEAVRTSLAIAQTAHVRAGGRETEATRGLSEGIRQQLAPGSDRAGTVENIEQAVKSLQSTIADKQDTLDQLASQIAEKESSLDDLQQQIEQRQDQADEHFARAQKLREQAFTAEGEKRFDLARQFALAGRAAPGRCGSASTRARLASATPEAHRAEHRQPRKAHQAVREPRPADHPEPRRCRRGPRCRARRADSGPEPAADGLPAAGDPALRHRRQTRQ